MIMFVSTVATGHFDFMAIGASRQRATGALLRGWHEHARQTGADPAYVSAEDINVVDGEHGQAFRDGAPYPHRSAH